MKINNSHMFLQFFQKKTFPFTESTYQKVGSNTKAINDLLSGRRKNSYGVEGMRITGRTDWKKIINVSDEMKQHIFNDVKNEFYKYGGISGNSTSETDAYYDKIHSYIKTVKASDRSSAAWTLSQLHLDLAHAVKSAVKAKIPNWVSGEQIPSDVLDEIFSDERITSLISGKSTETREFDIKV